MFNDFQRTDNVKLRMLIGNQFLCNYLPHPFIKTCSFVKIAETSRSSRFHPRANIQVSMRLCNFHILTTSIHPRHISTQSSQRLLIDTITQGELKYTKFQPPIKYPRHSRHPAWICIGEGRWTVVVVATVMILLAHFPDAIFADNVD